MNDDKLKNKIDKINFITNVINGCLWAYNDYLLDGIYRKAQEVQEKQVQEAKKTAEMFIDKIFGKGQSKEGN